MAKRAGGTPTGSIAFWSWASNRLTANAIAHTRRVPRSCPYGDGCAAALCCNGHMPTLFFFKESHSQTHHVLESRFGKGGSVHTQLPGGWKWMGLPLGPNVKDLQASRYGSRQLCSTFQPDRPVRGVQVECRWVVEHQVQQCTIMCTLSSIHGSS
jgi:hypothetical protein